MTTAASKHSVSAFDEATITAIRHRMRAVIDLAIRSCAALGKDEREMTEIEMRIRFDLLCFMLFVTQSDDAISDDELALINRILDLKLNRDDYLFYLEDVTDKEYEVNPPASFMDANRLFREALEADPAFRRLVTSNLEGAEFEMICPDGVNPKAANDAFEGTEVIENAEAALLVDLCACIGAAVIFQDKKTTEPELGKLIRQLKTINSALVSPDAPLPRGEALVLALAYKTWFAQ